MGELGVASALRFGKVFPMEILRSTFIEIKPWKTFPNQIKLHEKLALLVGVKY